MGAVLLLLLIVCLPVVRCDQGSDGEGLTSSRSEEEGVTGDQPQGSEDAKDPPAVQPDGAGVKGLGDQPVQPDEGDSDEALPG